MDGFLYFFFLLSFDNNYNCFKKIKEEATWKKWYSFRKERRRRQGRGNHVKFTSRRLHNNIVIDEWYTIRLTIKQESISVKD